MFPSALSPTYIPSRYCVEEVSGISKVRGNFFETVARKLIDKANNDFLKQLFIGIAIKDENKYKY